jgi:hypothetical protein
LRGRKQHNNALVQSNLVDWLVRGGRGEQQSPGHVLVVIDHGRWSIQLVDRKLVSLLHGHCERGGRSSRLKSVNKRLG